MNIHHLDQTVTLKKYDDTEYTKMENVIYHVSVVSSSSPASFRRHKRPIQKKRLLQSQFPTISYLSLFDSLSSYTAKHTYSLWAKVFGPIFAYSLKNLFFPRTKRNKKSRVGEICIKNSGTVG